MIDGMDSGITSQQLLVGFIYGFGPISILPENPDQIIYGTGTVPNITITENFLQALGTNLQEFVLNLPNGFEWKQNEVEVTFLFGLQGAEDVQICLGENSNNLKISFQPDKWRTQRGSIKIEPIIRVTKEATEGDIILKISNGDINKSVVVGKFVKGDKDNNGIIDLFDIINFTKNSIDVSAISSNYGELIE